MPKILIVEDEPAMQLGLKDNLEFEGYEIDLAGDGETAVDKISNGSFDLILLDIMLPKLSGLEVCKKIRKAGIETPIIFLTAKGQEIDKVIGLEIGADDYITKPFSLREMLARVKAVLRRSEGNSGGQGIEQIGLLSVDFKKYTAHREGTTVKLSHKEFEILSYLLKNRNEAVSRYDLLEKVWGYDHKPSTRTVDNFIVKLRQKLEEDASDPKVILTIHGAGYKLVL